MATTKTSTAKLTKLATLLLVALLIPATSHALKRCARTDGQGVRQLFIDAGDIDPADVTNKAADAWDKIANAAQQKYGGEVEVGQINLTIYANVGWGPFRVRTAIPGTFPMDYGGGESIGRAISRNQNTTPPSSPDPSPCDEEKNACCDECAAQFAVFNPNMFFSTGYLHHDAWMSTRRRNSSAKLSLRINSKGREVYA